MAAKKTIISLSDIDDLLDLKKPWVAALLTWLIPGAGQIYQGRTFKGFLFCVCILGMYFCGIQLGEGHPVYCYYETKDLDDNPANNPRYRNYGYLSQFLVGLPSLPAIIQAKRFSAPSNNHELDAPLDISFSGLLQRNQEEVQQVVGTLSLQMAPGRSGPEIKGRLLGTLQPSGERVDLELGREPSKTPLGRKIEADPERKLVLQVTNVVVGPNIVGTMLYGTIPRPVYNWYQVPLQDKQLQNMNGRLGKRWELAMVFTWIAGLLNILAIWDAFEGPAYGLLP